MTTTTESPIAEISARLGQAARPGLSREQLAGVTAVAPDPLPEQIDTIYPWRIPVSSRLCAVYYNGIGRVRAPRLEALRKHARVLLIDVIGDAYEFCSVADREQFDIPDDVLRAWVLGRLAKPGRVARVYCDLSNWPAALAACEGLPVRWWIANPTGQLHLVDGSDCTQYGWFGWFDKSMIGPRWITDWNERALYEAA